MPATDVAAPVGAGAALSPRRGDGGAEDPVPGGRACLPPGSPADGPTCAALRLAAASAIGALQAKLLAEAEVQTCLCVYFRTHSACDTCSLHSLGRPSGQCGMSDTSTPSPRQVLCLCDEEWGDKEAEALAAGLTPATAPKLEQVHAYPPAHRFFPRPLHSFWADRVYRTSDTRSYSTPRPPPVTPRADKTTRPYRYSSAATASGPPAPPRWAAPSPCSPR